MDKSSRKKKSLLINPAFQWTLIGYASAVATVILVSMHELNSFAFGYFNEIGLLAGLPKDHVYFEFIHMQEATVFRTFIAISCLVAIVLILGGLFVSHRIAGPVYRMKKDLERMTADNQAQLKEIHFRKGDYFPELAEAFNALVKSRNELSGTHKEAAQKDDSGSNEKAS